MYTYFVLVAVHMILLAPSIYVQSSTVNMYMQYVTKRTVISRAIAQSCKKYASTSRA